MMKIDYRADLDNIDWHAVKAALTSDQFDNGRNAQQLEMSFRNSRSFCIAWHEGQVVGTARVLSDGVCNAYLVDVWTHSPMRGHGIATAMVHCLISGLPGQHVYLQTDDHLVEFYRKLGFTEQPVGMSRIVGKWLVNS
jgi:predicted GNAT family acetyltransferase